MLSLTLDHYFVFTKQKGKDAWLLCNQLSTGHQLQKACSDFESFRFSVDLTMDFTKTSYHCTHNDE